MEKIDADKHYELTKIIAALPNELEAEEETAKRFDYLMLKLMLTVLSPHKDYEKLRDQAILIANQLEEKGTIPMVNAEMELIQELQRDEYWHNITVLILESVQSQFAHWFNSLIRTSDTLFIHILPTNSEHSRRGFYTAAGFKPSTI